ncbi:BcepNY3gp18 [Burkholderia phage BcepNY3]|uniref:Gp20 n=2 Tax=Naesvirus TaxID=2733115 RepID=Q6UJ12_9CAUD|nr:gp20 [Burkholderia phage Bcep1]YP_001294856.1 BcepNY3gp18 [Burkholderia phage BcepNY3]AAQ73366.1 gp20 [Burkholderia phage Bcep1]ABR10553.1 BcepNY3gp18 [Burkholderia phage BcepNY3]
MADLQPIKASLVADLVDLINENLADLLKVRTATCPDCGGSGTVGGERKWNDRGGTDVFDDGTLTTCVTCGGVGAIERFEIDHDLLKSRRFGRYVEGFDVKHGIIVPKMRSKDKAFAMLVKLLGFDKAVIEVANGASFVDTVSDEQRAVVVEQLKELAAMGLLDGR